MILLLAASMHEASAFATKHDIPKWHYVYGTSSLKGLGRPFVCRVGMYWQRHDIVAIEHELAARKAVSISPVDTARKTQ